MDTQTLEKLENSLDTYLKIKKKVANEILEVLKNESENYGELEDKLVCFKASVYWSKTNVDDFSPLFSAVHRLIEQEKSKAPIYKVRLKSSSPMKISDQLADAIITAIREGKLRCK